MTKHRETQRGKEKPPKTFQPLVMQQLCEVTVAEGLEAITVAELQHKFGARVLLHAQKGTWNWPGSLRFDYTGELDALLTLQTVISVYLVLHFAVPRPRALLGNEHLFPLLDWIKEVRAISPAQSYQTFYLSVAGSDTLVIARLKAELTAHTGMKAVEDEKHGHLQLRLRRPPDKEAGWDLLLRLSPRPLAARAWRVCNLPGALSAPVAHAMARLTQPTTQDVFLNPGCGSGTLLIERLACGPARRVIGCDTDPEALECTHLNVKESGHRRAEVYGWDMRELPLPGRSVDVLCFDLPFGHRISSHEENKALYPLMLHEAARVAKPDARCLLLTHERILTEEIVRQSRAWTLQQALKISLPHVRPTLFLLRRNIQ